MVTTDINFRMVYGIPDRNRELEVMLKYIKANKMCNIAQDPSRRSSPHIITPQFNPDFEVNSTLIAVNAKRAKEMQEICKREGLSSLILQPKHITLLYGFIGKPNEIQRIREFLNIYDVYLCHQRLTTDLNIIMRTD